MTSRIRKKRTSDEASLHEEEEAEYEPEEVEEDDEPEEPSPKRPALDKENAAANEAMASPRRKLASSTNKPPEAGIIKQIYMENFMCHRKLTVDLCRNVNFISGQNGSGKSAILAAIQICLGAGARRTNRARNLKELVRRDAAAANPASAKIRVTLLNQGSDAYKPELYGETISVERVISLKGGYSGYKLLDSNFKERSRSKKDLDEMLDTLNIQVENPVAVLDQEEAKKFLMGKATDKYSFFMKATELERCDRTYRSAVDTVAELSQTEESLSSILKPAGERVRELKKKWDQHMELTKLQGKLQKYQYEYAWAFYAAALAEHAEAVEKMKQFEERAAKKREEITQAEDANSQGDEEAAKRVEMEELVQEAQEQTQLKRNWERELKELQAPQRHLERQLKSLQQDQVSAQQQVVAAKQRLQEVRDKMVEQAGSAQSEEARRAAILKEAEEGLAEARDRVNELRQQVSLALRSYEELEPQVQGAKAATGQVSRQLQSQKGALSELQNSSAESLAIWGRRVEKVHRLVEQGKRSFKGPVYGPIGAFIKVYPGKEEFAALAELAAGSNNLDRFIVTNDHDRRLFQNIRQKAGCGSDCGVFQVSAAPRYRVPTPPDGVETAASVLHIDNDIVFNCLVDNASIDTKALMRDKASSEAALLVRNGGKCSIRGGIKQVLYFPNGDSWQVKNGSLAVFSNEKKLRQSIGVDKTAAIEQAKRDVSQLSEDLKELRKDEARLEQQHTQYQRQWNQAKKAMQQNDARIHDLTSKIDEVRAEMETNANVTIDTTEYEEDVTQANQTVEELAEKESTIREELQERVPEIASLRKKLQECTARNEQVLSDMKKAEHELNTILDTQSQKKDLIQQKKTKLAKYEAAISKHQEIVDNLAGEEGSALGKARKLTFRYRLREQHDAAEEQEGDEPVEEIRSDPTEEELEAIEPIQVGHDCGWYEPRISRTKKKISEEKDKKNISNEDSSVAREKYMRALNDYKAKAAQAEEIGTRIVELTDDIKDRKKKWKQFRKHLAKTTAMKFDETLQLNNYTGDLAYDTTAQTLDLKVNKAQADNAGAAASTDLKGLSGGERSWSTICLILALGETLETPFRILDEFDVFLDPQVRRLTIKSLCHVAKQMDHRQFIFITPQDLASLNPDSKLKVLKLSPPTRRNEASALSQQTLDFGSQS